MPDSSPDAERPQPRRSPRLADLGAVVVGYGIAALLIRAFAHSDETLDATVAAVLVVAYLWLGLAISGPLVLLLDRRLAPRQHAPLKQKIGSVAVGQGPEPAQLEPSAGHGSRYTRAELAWLAVGAYWIVMTLIIVPTRMRDTPLALIAVLQIAGAIGVWVVGPRAGSGDSQTTGWTHKVAIIVLITWPIAWAAMILLSKSIL